ncbi:hypothetical protein Pfo_026558 [Paulownia fortunei]|nr:hypothetical protein Pfo_026558 [Paulownia fortunei]
MMAGSGTQELGKLGKKKPKTGILGDGPSSVPSLSSFWRGKGRMADRGICDGTAESGGGEELEVAPEEGSQDPLVVFGSGIMMMTFSKLDARSVALACLVSRGWFAVASADKIWALKLLVEGICTNLKLLVYPNGENERPGILKPS